MNPTRPDREPKAKVSSYPIKEDQTLETFLGHIMQGKSRQSLKKLLSNGDIQLDGRPLKRLDEPLKAGQSLSIGKPDAARLPEGLEILFEDPWLLVVKKDSGLLTVGNHSEKRLTAEEYLNRYMRLKKQGDRIYVVHRIDRDTSGVLLFAKTLKASERLRTTWHESVESRQYVAIAEGKIYPPQGTIDTYLDEDARESRIFVCPPGQGKRAITHYRMVKSVTLPAQEPNNKAAVYSLLELELDTGRRNQIRVHLAHLGCPIAGDAKYGALSDPCGRLCLHARQIRFQHPITGKTLEFTSDIPASFLRLFSE